MGSLSDLYALEYTEYSLQFLECTLSSEQNIEHISHSNIFWDIYLKFWILIGNTAIWGTCRVCLDNKI